MGIFRDFIRSALFAGAIGVTLLPAVHNSAWAAGDPSQVNFTLEGCRNDGTITLPNGSGKFICPDAAYTTGNLGKGWNELDLVPFRLTTDAGNAAPASQTYTIAIVLDNIDGGKPGYDVLSAPVLNTALSAASCTAATVGAATLLNPGFGGISQSLYRLVTITQAQNTTCVYDYFGRLALGSHLFPGSSLHANLANQSLTTAGIGSKEVSIPVKEISPQELRKDTTAKQDSDHAWNLTKEADKASVSFGDVCAADAPKPQTVTFTVKWTKLAAQGGLITAVANIYAKNPASRVITVDVTDQLYQGTTQTTLLGTTTSGPVDVPAGTEILVLTHTASLPASAGNVGDYLNDVATATYTDKVTGIAVPGQTTAVAQAQIASGAESNTTAGIRDTESITGNYLTFSVAQPSVGAFVGNVANPTPYVAGTETTGPVLWSAGAQSVSGSVDFVKTIYLAGKKITTGTLTDTANLRGSDGFSATSGPVTVKIDSTASVKLTITKRYEGIVLDTGETLKFFFDITRTGDGTFKEQRTFTFVAGGATQQSIDITGLVPDTYTVKETGSKFYPVGCAIDSCSLSTGLGPASDTQNVDLNVDATRSNCSGTALFENKPLSNDTHAAVQKVTDPLLDSGDPDYKWTFTLKGPGIAAAGETIDVNANAAAVNFSALLLEGTYTVTETTKSGWDLTSVSPNAGGQLCQFSVDFPEDFGKTFTCTFKNVKRGKAKVVKTVSGQPPSGSLQFTFQLRKDASITQNGTTLETQTATAANGGVFTFSTLLIPGNHYQLCEVVMPGWLTSLGTFVPGSFNPPDGVAPNPNTDNSILCADFTVGAGETKTFTVDNSPPPGGRALTIGFWKNWASCTNSSAKKKPILDRTMAAATPPGIQVDSKYLLGNPGNPDVAPDCLKAVRLLDKSTIDTDKKMASDPLYNMAAQLVAAELNYAAGATKCPKITTTMTSANALLTQYGFTGTGNYASAMTAADKVLANNWAQKLDDYNNNRPNACQ